MTTSETLLSYRLGWAEALPKVYFALNFLSENMHCDAHLYELLFYAF